MVKALGVSATPTVLCRSAAFHLLWQLTLTASIANVTASAPAPTLSRSRGTQAVSCREMAAARQGTCLWREQCWRTAGGIMTWHLFAVYLNLCAAFFCCCLVEYVVVWNCCRFKYDLLKMLPSCSPPTWSWVTVFPLNTSDSQNRPLCPFMSSLCSFHSLSS